MTATKNDSTQLKGTSTTLKSLKKLLPPNVNALIGGQAVIYLYDKDQEQLALSDRRRSGRKFAAALPIRALSGLTLKKGNGKKLEVTTVTPRDMSRILPETGPKERPLVLARPIYSEGDLLGLLVLDVDKEITTESEAKKQLDTVGEVVQQSLVQGVRLNNLRSRNEFLAKLLNQAREIDITSTPETLIKNFVKRVKAVLPYDRLTISSRQTEQLDGLQIVWVDGIEDKYAKGLDYASKNICHGEVFRKGQGILIDQFDSSHFRGRIKAGDFKKTKLKSFLGVPIIEAGVPKGVLAVESLNPGEYKADDLEILSFIAQVFGPSMSWSKLYHETHAMATIDGLTQILNHRSFMERISVEMERCARYSERMTFLMLDLDSFKRVNDTYGHLFGDYVLRKIAKIIRHSIRKADIAGRLGGEEFGVIIINADEKTSCSTARRILESIAGYHFDHDGNKCRVTVSIGMSDYPDDVKKVKDILINADEAMYLVKEQGGNEVIAHSHVHKRKKRKS